MVLVGGGLYGARQLRSFWGVTLSYVLVIAGVVGILAAAGFAGTATVFTVED